MTGALHIAHTRQQKYTPPPSSDEIVVARFEIFTAVINIQASPPTVSLL
jgi:hypothetical protein